MHFGGPEAECYGLNCIPTKFCAEALNFLRWHMETGPLGP